MNSPEPQPAETGNLPAAPAPCGSVRQPGPDPDQGLDEVITLLRSDPRALAQVVSQLAPDDARRDGWTPFARRLFLEVLSETGRVSLACDYARLSKQSAYALRARDPVFAAGWDAACELALAPLADALYERALDGVTETITRDGDVVATRHRFDSRLSVSVLTRLDKRCDRALETGARHLALVRRWDDWLNLVGKGEDEAARALLESAPGENSNPGQPGQLLLGTSPTPASEEPAEIDLSDRCWIGDDRWLTDFPPPPGFHGWQKCEWGDPDTDYERECSAEEVEILEAGAQADRERERIEEERLRESWFELLRSELGAELGTSLGPAASEAPPAAAGSDGQKDKRKRSERSRRSGGGGQATH